jgi:general secretion pathway protein H
MTSRRDPFWRAKEFASPGLDPGVHVLIGHVTNRRRGWPDQVRPRRKKNETAGFTLIELLVVLAIAGVMLAIAVPLLAAHATGASLNAATREIRAALRDARSTAIADDRPVIFRGDPGGGYWLDRNHFTLPIMTGGPPLQVAVLGGAQISFYPSGGSSGGHILVASGSGQREIAVDTLTGRADER